MGTVVAVFAAAAVTVAAAVYVASASCAAALRADLSIGVGGKLIGGVCGSS